MLRGAQLVGPGLLRMLMMPSLLPFHHPPSLLRLRTLEEGLVMAIVVAVLSFVAVRVIVHLIRVILPAGLHA